MRMAVSINVLTKLLTFFFFFFLFFLFPFQIVCKLQNITELLYEIDLRIKTHKETTYDIGAKWQVFFAFNDLS